MVIDFYDVKTGDSLGGHRGSFTAPRVGDHVRINRKLWLVQEVIWHFDDDSVGPLVATLMLTEPAKT